jgi:hypothetical protein
VTAVERWLEEHAGDIAFAIDGDDQLITDVLRDCAAWEPPEGALFMEMGYGWARTAEAAERIGRLGIVVSRQQLRKLLTWYGYTGVADDDSEAGPPGLA